MKEKHIYVTDAEDNTKIKHNMITGLQESCNAVIAKTMGIYKKCAIKKRTEQSATNTETKNEGQLIPYLEFFEVLNEAKEESDTHISLMTGFSCTEGNNYDHFRNDY